MTLSSQMISSVLAGVSPAKVEGSPSSGGLPSRTRQLWNRGSAAQTPSYRVRVRAGTRKSPRPLTGYSKGKSSVAAWGTEQSSSAV